MARIEEIPCPRFDRRRELARLQAMTLIQEHRISLRELQDLDREISMRRIKAAARVGTVRTLMAEYQIGLDDLLDREAMDPRRGYQHPRTGDHWDGQGEQPEWLRNALLREGYRPAELRVA